MFRILFLLCIFSPLLYAAGPRWDNSIDINDPNLTGKVAAEQCHKSLINAPEKLELWCEKAIELGHWDSLVTLSMHTGNGSRLIAEAKKRMEEKEPQAYSIFAWLYRTGTFVEQDINYAMSLYKELIKLDIERPNSLITAAHLELAYLYKAQQRWAAMNEHAQYVYENTKITYHKERAAELLELAAQSAITN
ncbi:hypothetical protein [Pseudoalteromonas sp. T1lg21]|uniref:hypothetical protein n=1 Tax=Pseudoalteromonas sp. T1lg21 TaxID=2077095 RepID=UPI000CF69A4C|nr:hypothetical protein [Pseudoalteromonas sp. T1lg21]